MPYAILFVFGLIVGSFLNVVALRYDGEHFIFDPKVIGGRSHCPHCNKTLQWYELVPVVSFIIQRRRCRNCKAKIGFQYPLVEIISGCLFAFIPLHTFSLTGPGQPFIALSIMWVIAFEIFLLISYVDLRLGIIPDELNILLGIVGIFFIIFLGGYFGPVNHSLVGHYALYFAIQGDLWTNHIFAALAAFLFFGILVLATRGKGMGLGDVKLALPLGLLFGWPDIGLLILASFIIGAFIGLIFIALKKKTMKGSLPFAPFLALGATTAFFWGIPIAQWYFHMLGL